MRSSLLYPVGTSMVGKASLNSIKTFVDAKCPDKHTGSKWSQHTISGDGARGPKSYC
jgi:hypothetical protein